MWCSSGGGCAYWALAQSVLDAVRCVCRRYCEQDLHRFVVLFCFRCGGGVLLLHGDKLVAKASQRHWEKMFDIATGGLMFHQFFI